MPDQLEITRHFIDIEKLFGIKNPKLRKMLPKFIFNYLRRIVHEDFINLMIYRYRDKSGLDFVSAIVAEFGVRMKVYPPSPGAPILPPAGRIIVSSNHPLGGLDGLVLIHVVGQVRPDLIFPVNDLLTFIPGLKPLFIPINKHGRNTENIEIIDTTFASDKVILYFPAGLVSRKHAGGIIKDLDWKKTFISKAKRYHRDIIPVYISGRNSDFFYNLANWRRRLGIKSNIEMLYLPDEMIRQKDRTVKIIFGEPVSYLQFDKTRSDARWAEYVREKVYQLEEKV
jgi:putative hemolysin